MKTEIIRLNGETNDSAKIERAAAVLDEGGLVAFPTETVWGIGCIARADAIARLDEVKGRGADKRYTLHIGDKEQLAGYVGRVGLRGRKLIEKAWPGPLTLVFEPKEEVLARQEEKLGADTFSVLYQGSSIGVRCPDNSIAANLLSKTTRPVVAPSANISGRPPATTFEEVLSTFDGKIEMILAPNKNEESAKAANQVCKYNQSSTVVKIKDPGFDILRVGFYSEEDIFKMSKVGLLFVCTGNTCRSPMAEYFCRQYIAEKLNCDLDETEQMGYKIRSAGVACWADMPASDEVVEICRLRNIDASGHRSSPLVCDEIEEYDLVLAMTRGHIERIVEICPGIKDKCMLLDRAGDIPDPIGGDGRIYNECAKQIEIALKEMLGEVL